MTYLEAGSGMSRPFYSLPKNGTYENHVLWHPGMMFDHFKSDLDASLYLHRHCATEQLASAASVGLEGVDGKAPAGFSFYQECDVVEAIPLAEAAEETPVLFDDDLEEGGQGADMFVQGFAIQSGFICCVAFEVDGPVGIFFRIQLDNQYQSRHQAIEIPIFIFLAGFALVFFRKVSDVEAVNVWRFLEEADFPGCRTGLVFAGELKGAEIR
jgi:hypothetical protein